MIKIFDFRHGARGLRAAWLCEEMGLPHSFVPVNFPPGDEYRAMNPFGTVPLLQDGAVLMSESVAMMLYIARTYGPTPLLPLDHHEHFALVLQFTIFGEASLSARMGPLLTARFGAPKDQNQNWSVKNLEAALGSTLKHLDQELSTREFLVGNDLTLADISVATALKIWTNGLALDLPPFLAAYCERLKNRDAYQRATAEHQ